MPGASFPTLRPEVCMEITFTCPKCARKFRTDADQAVSQATCTDCGQEFIVGAVGTPLPVVHPMLVTGRHSADAETARPTSRAPGSVARTHPDRITGKLEKAPERIQQERRCSACGSSMLESEYVTARGSMLGLGDVVEWHCQKCGKEIRLAGARRLLLALLGCPLIVLWWLLFTQSPSIYGVSSAWWSEWLAYLAPRTSTGAFWYIAFLLLFSLGPIELLRQMFIRLRNPKI